MANLSMFQPNLVLKMVEASSLFYEALRTGNVEDYHKYLDLWNQYRQQMGYPLYVSPLTDEEIARNKH